MSGQTEPSTSQNIHLIHTGIPRRDATDTKPIVKGQPYENKQENPTWRPDSSCRRSDTSHRRQYSLHEIGNEGTDAEFSLEARAD